MSESWRKSREIIERIVVEGDLVLLTPTSLGNGDSDGLTDMSLLLDEYEGKALLTGTSTAGALRNYLRECLLNFGASEESQYKDGKGNRLKVKDANGNIVKDANGKSINISLPIVTQLFGSLEDEDGAQSLLIIDDALSNAKPTTELRDGVRINYATRTAEDKAKFDLELLEAGTTFKLRFELLISEGQNRNDLVSAFATALQGFENSEIFLGARKRRGYGECKISKWRVKPFELIANDKKGLIDWLRNGAKPLADLAIAEKDSIELALSFSPIQDRREYFEMTACFALDGSMLIRSGSRLQGVRDKGQPDAVHLRSNRNGNSKAIVSGTSLAGVLRHRAVKICNTISNGNGEKFVEKMFGVDMKNNTKETFASRLEVRETEIDESKTNSLVQTRVKIDRFTGGAYEGALFDAAPVFAKSNEKAIELSLKLRSVRLTKDEEDKEKEQRTKAEIGLLLLLLKDLWTSDLAIGGESSIGRGRLKGISANLHYRKNDNEFWKISLKETDKINVQLEAGNLPNGETEIKFLNDLVEKNLKSELEKSYAKN
jgi:CRISPR/Cas system CSM-associated protein Csm3 (group 7 of RAMP superfamily)